ncbi:serine dehydratase [Ornatilinea apprima]|uniref:L-serine dehydratase n=1 Tax=Ornatilinea apprima TaxID=1134406 RepID=A0A0P6YA47_9CHLR|nr:L-serine ammonia-lyase [Ornatilinea apprima]KPL78695.1 serine dehydratase [Ornatilinea apprima]
MESIQSLFRVGHGPSSSHTIGPQRAAEDFYKRVPHASSIRVTLFGSLAATGKGHLTDLAITRALAPCPVELVWKPDELLPAHPNGMRFEALDEQGQQISVWQGYSVGGGAILEEGQKPSEAASVYPLGSMRDIMKLCTQTGQAFWEYVETQEGPEIWGFLSFIWQTMQQSIQRGLQAEGVLPGGLGVSRKASVYYRKIKLNGANFLKHGYLPAYALAVAEENATGGLIVTAPTCGSGGVLPSVLKHVQDHMDCSEAVILRALATAGLIGNLIKHNASISGAEVGCQGEIGSACAMAAAAATQILGGTIRQIEYAAEMGLEHHLGLTCDPVNGLVQIPCIERNAFAATRAMDCASYALYSDGTHRVSFDEVLQVMKQTGHDLPSLYRETASGGLALTYRFPPQSPADTRSGD